MTNTKDELLEEFITSLELYCKARLKPFITDIKRNLRPSSWVAGELTKIKREVENKCLYYQKKSDYLDQAWRQKYKTIDDIGVIESNLPSQLAFIINSNCFKRLDDAIKSFKDKNNEGIITLVSDIIKFIVHKCALYRKILNNQKLTKKEDQEEGQDFCDYLNNENGV